MLGSVRAARWRHVVLAGCAVVLGSATAVEAQSTEARLVQRRLEYRAARDQWESARSAVLVFEADFASALEAAERARRRGDDDARERALAVAQERSGPLRSQTQRVEDAADDLDRARTALIEVIAVRMENLVDDMRQASSRRERDRLDVLFRDLRNELAQLEDEIGSRVLIDPVALPDVVFDPRDGPEELEIKAQIMERRAAFTDSAVVQVDREIRDLGSRLRNERRRADFLAGTERFDDTRLPVVGGTPPGDAPVAPGDSVSGGGRPATLDERIRLKQQYREQLLLYRDQLLIRARAFRQAVGFIS